MAPLPFWLRDKDKKSRPIDKTIFKVAEEIGPDLATLPAGESRLRVHVERNVATCRGSGISSRTEFKNRELTRLFDIGLQAHRGQVPGARKKIGARKGFISRRPRELRRTPLT